MSMSTWREIIGYSRYGICTDGRIYSLITKRILKGWVHKGYLRVHLIDDDFQHKYLFVHKLVAENFLPNTYNKKYIKHINDNLLDNRVENLKWCSRSEITIESIAKGYIPYKIPAKRGIQNKNSKIVLQIKGNKIVNKFYGGEEAARKLGVSRSAIYYRLYNPGKKLNGFKFIFKERKK